MKIAIKTYGCAMNQADSEMIAGLLKERGFNITGFSDSDIVVVNTCTVKAPTEHKILKKLKELESSGKQVIVSGCMPPAIPGLADKFPSFSFIGVNVSDIVDAVLCTEEGKRFVRISGGKHKTCKVSLPRIRRNPVTEIIPISEGCVGNCTYCQTRLARGQINSYPGDAILKQIQSAVDDGVKEIWITSQDNVETGYWGGAFASCVASSAADPRVMLYANSQDAYRSGDGGKTWKPVTSTRHGETGFQGRGMEETYAWGVAFHPSAQNSNDKLKNQSQ